jgi:hypothetical protein
LSGFLVFLVVVDHDYVQSVTSKHGEEFVDLLLGVIVVW